MNVCMMKCECEKRHKRSIILNSISIWPDLCTDVILVRHAMLNSNNKYSILVGIFVIDSQQIIYKLIGNNGKKDKE